MRKLATLALIALSVFALASTSVAQAEPGDLGIFLDPAGTVSTGPLPVFVPTFFYVIGFELGGITGWESSVTISDPTILVLSTALNPGTALNVGQPGNFIVGLGACIDGGPAHTLVTYQIGNFSGVPVVDVLACVGGSSPSSFGGLPGYSTCADELIPFGAAQNGQATYPNGCAVFNATDVTPISTENLSLGAVKAKF